MMIKMYIGIKIVLLKTAIVNALVCAIEKEKEREKERERKRERERERERENESLSNLLHCFVLSDVARVLM